MSERISSCTQLNPVDSWRHESTRCDSMLLERNLFRKSLTGRVLRTTVQFERYFDLSTSHKTARPKAREAA